jgi:hypothetical protein
MTKLATPLAGKSQIPNSWCVSGLDVVDLDGVQADVELMHWTPTFSAFEFAYGLVVADAPSATGITYGSVHRHQLCTSVAIALDGDDLSILPPGSGAYGNRLVLSQTMDDYLDDEVTVFGASELVHIFDAYGMEIRHSHTYEAGYQLYNDYVAMMPQSNRDYKGIDTYQMGSLAARSRAYDDGNYDSNSEFLTYLCWHATQHPYRMRMEVFDPMPTWVAWYEDRGPAPSDPEYYFGYGKFYVQAHQNWANRVTAEANSGRARYRVDRWR